MRKRYNVGLLPGGFKMKKVAVLFLCVLLLFVAACSQNSGKRKTNAVSPVVPTQDRQNNAVNTGKSEQKGMPVEFNINKEGLDASILELYNGINIKITNRKTQVAQEKFIPFMTPVKLEGTPLTITVTNFLPDFVMTEGGYTTRSYEPNNPGAKVKITGGTPEFEGWLFVNFPDIHPYDNPDYNVVMINADKK